MTAILCLAAGLTAACAPAGPQRATEPVPGHEGADKTAAIERAVRRAFDGAPPVIAHSNFGIDCQECHDAEGMAVPDLGFAPPSPHEVTAGIGQNARCRQCHVFQETEELWKANAFKGFAQDLRRGRRFADGSPPVVPHKVFMRENCVACHSGPAAREEIRSTHPERTRCQQCHVEQRTTTTFAAAFPLPLVEGSS